MNKMPSTVVLLIQKEVAEKITESIPKNNYFAAFVQSFYNVDLLEIVPNTAFDLKPKVDSAVIRLMKRANIPFKEIADKRKYEGFLHRGFSNPRKMLNKVFTQEELDMFEVDGKLRAQNIDTKDWIKMFKKKNG